jgi:acyl-CoA synthetase (AMP-forming)/AMP-acid ligase II
VFHSPPHRVEAYRKKGWWRGETVDQLFRAAVQTGGEREALVDPPNRAGMGVLGEPQRLSWQEVDAAVDAVARAFQAHGVRRDDIVLAQLPNIVEGVLAFLACARIGAILSPTAMAYREHELRSLLAKIQPKLVLTVDHFGAHRHAAIAVKLREAGLFDGAVLCVGECQTPGAEALDLTLKGTIIAPEPPIEASETLTICWTSGTEAAPKGVPRHHDHWRVNGEAMMEATGLQTGDVLLNPFPLINIAAFGGVVMPWLICAGRMVQHHPFDPGIFLDQLCSEGINYTVAPPAILNMLLKNEAALAGADLSQLRCLGSGSAPLSAWMVRGWQERHGVPVMNVFGSNEGCSLFSSAIDVPDPDLRARLFPRFGVEGMGWNTAFPMKILTRLVDPDTETEIDKPGKAGELRLDGAMVFDGYWVKDGIDRSCFDSEGYFRTGDLFEIAQEGEGRFYRFVGRTKEIIIRGGVNISPAELDSLIEGHPAVREAACVGYPDERLGERVCAVVALKPEQTLTLENLLEFLKLAELATYKLPERLLIVEALPRNPLGKVLRRDLEPLVAGPGKE